MIRMSALRNRPVICSERQIGLLQSIGLDQAQKTVQVLIIAGGFKGKRVVYADQIQSITTNFIFVSNTEKYRKRCEPSRLRFVRDEEDLLVGMITDYLIDETKMCVAAFEMMTGLLTREQRARVWILSWSAGRSKEDELLISSELSNELIDQSREA